MIGLNVLKRSYNNQMLKFSYMVGSLSTLPNRDKKGGGF